MATRYEGKPLLRVLECYALWAINELPAKDEELLERLTPQLQQVYKASGTWQEIIEKVMELPSTIPASIRDLWAKNTAIAQEKNVRLSPQQFAEMFVDQNLIV